MAVKHLLPMLMMAAAQRAAFCILATVPCFPPKITDKNTQLHELAQLRDIANCFIHFFYKQNKAVVMY